MSQKDWKQTNSRIWLAEIDLDRSLGYNYNNNYNNNQLYFSMVILESIKYWSTRGPQNKLKINANTYNNEVIKLGDLTIKIWWK